MKLYRLSHRSGLKLQRAVMPTALFDVRLRLPAAVVAGAIVRRAIAVGHRTGAHRGIAIIIGPDHATGADRTRLLIVADHAPLPISRLSIVAVIVAVAVRGDWG